MAQTESKSSYYIYSTLSNDQAYVKWGDGPKGGLPSRDRTVFISGKANIITKNLITPKGVLTIVSDDDMKVLAENSSFKNHKNNGFISVEKKKAESVDEVADNMTKKDSSAQLVGSDFKKAPTTLAKAV